MEFVPIFCLFVRNKMTCLVLLPSYEPPVVNSWLVYKYNIISRKQLWIFRKT